MYAFIDALTIAAMPRWMRGGTNDNDPWANYAGRSAEHPVGAAPFQAVDRVDGLVAKGLDKLRTSRRRRRAIRALDRLSDRNLADIGLHRGGIVSVVDEVIAGGTPRRSERVVRGTPKSAGGPATVNDNVTDIAA